MSNIVKHESPTFQITTLDEAMRYATAIADAGIVPQAFKRQPANILVAQEISKALGESVWVTMSEMSIISGRPSFSAKFMRSRVRQAGHRLRESFDKETGTARAVIIRSDDPEFEHVAEWDQAKAEQHQLWGKGHWQKNPELMLKNRALSEVVREACYEVMGGVAYTPDEVQDFAPVRNDAQRMDHHPQQAPQAPQESVPYWWTAKDQRDRDTYVSDFTESLLAAERDGDEGRIGKLSAFVERHGDGDLVRMAQQTVNRMRRNAAQDAPQDVEEVPVDPEGGPTVVDAVENAQTVLDAEVVNA